MRSAWLLIQRPKIAARNPFGQATENDLWNYVWQPSDPPPLSWLDCHFHACRPLWSISDRIRKSFTQKQLGEEIARRFALLPECRGAGHRARHARFSCREGSGGTTARSSSKLCTDRKSMSAIAACCAGSRNQCPPLHRRGFPQRDSIEEYSSVGLQCHSLLISIRRVTSCSAGDRSRGKNFFLDDEFLSENAVRAPQSVWFSVRSAPKKQETFAMIWDQINRTITFGSLRLRGAESRFSVTVESK